ncbi:MAG TPA: diacylglycerol kinase family protein [Candidatus Saccharimonadia bacterium]|nr:diacylglycerol kinase family protein [Candidatus Saccharimonadia bacterium]
MSVAAASPAWDSPAPASHAEPAVAPARRFVVVYNARSGYWIAQPEGSIETRLEALSQAHGVELVAHSLDCDDIAASLRDALATNPDALFVSGGDGTINSVVAALEGRRVPLGIIPSGTMNLLARDLGMPLEFDAAIEALLSAEPHEIDLARVNGKPYLCNSMIGLMPHIARAREQARGQGHWRLSPRVLRKTLWLWRNYPRVWVELLDAGATLRLRTRAITISNNRLNEGSAPIPGRDHLDRGTLGVYVLHDRSRWALFRIGWKILMGTWHEDRDVVIYETTSLVIDLGSKRQVTVSSDGEQMQLEAPLRYTIEPKAVIVLRPKPVPPPMP